MKTKSSCKVLKIKQSCGGQGCELPAHEKILPRLIKLVPLTATLKKAA